MSTSPENAATLLARINELGNTCSYHEKKNQGLRARNKELCECIKELEAEVEHLRAVNAGLREDYNKNFASLVAANETVAAYESDYNQVVAERDRAIAERDQVVAERNEARIELAGLRAIVAGENTNQTNNELAKLRDLMTGLVADNQRAHRALEHANDWAYEWREQCMRVRREIEEKADINAGVRWYMDSYDELKHIMEGQNDLITDLRGELQGVKQLHSEAISAILFSTHMWNAFKELAGIRSEDIREASRIAFERLQSERPNSMRVIVM